MTATPTPDPYREWDAAYVLGSLGPGDRREFERHLATCEGCQVAVSELAGMPGLLGLVPSEHATALADDAAHGAGDQTAAGGPPSGAVVPLAEVAAAARRRRARRRALLSAAAVALVLGGVVGGVAVAGWPRSPGSVPPGPPVVGGTAAGRLVALEPVDSSDVRADLVLTPAAWGTRIDWSCSYPDGPAVAGATYELVLVDASGAREVVATWSATEAGSSDGLGASSAVPVDGIARVELGVVGMDGALAAADV